MYKLSFLAGIKLWKLHKTVSSSNKKMIHKSWLDTQELWGNSKQIQIWKPAYSFFLSHMLMLSAMTSESDFRLVFINM